MQTDSPHNEQADRAVAFINALKHTSGRFKGEPFNLRPWQENQIVRPLFGTLRPDGLRQYRTLGLFIPRKQGKTELSAAFGLYLLCADGEQSAEVILAASDRDQAGILFTAAARMVRSNATLAKVCKIVDSQKRIVYKPTDSLLRAIPSDAPGAFGFNASAIIIDELHAQPDGSLVDALETSTGARLQPITIKISTAGYDRESECFRVWDYARKVRDGIIEDPQFLPAIWEAPEDADWQDENVWARANPALGDFRSIDDMKQMAHEAKELPAKVNTFRTWFLNQWVQSATLWLPPGAWEACGDNFDIEALEGRECFAGLDLAYRSDFAALVLLFPSGESFDVLPFFWLPRDGNRQLEREPYASWVRHDHVELTPGASTEFGLIRQRINQLQQRFNIRKIAVDPWNARQLSSELLDDGFEVVEFRQQMQSMNEPTKQLESLIKSKRIRHDANPIMRWMMSNVMIESDSSGNYRPSKKKSTEKIDGVVSAVMALGVSMTADTLTSVYGTPGNLAL